MNADLSMTTYQPLCIISPATGQQKSFLWSPCKPGEIRDDNAEIVDIISFITEDVDELKHESELTKLLKCIDKSSYSAVSKLCSTFNSSVKKLLKKWDDSSIQPTFLQKKASLNHVQFILYQCYNRAVAEPDKLNQYPPFSPQVYGETSFELISQMIDTVNITSDESFIDLGSGVGQVVLQVAACSNAKFCYGIEKAEYPAACACRLDAEFRHWMAFYGKPYRPFVLERGDFLSAEYQERIFSAGVLFANNFAFGPEVDHQLKQRFANLKEGARVISSKAFCPLNFRITDRNLGDIGSIMHVTCLNPIQDAVSWTDKPFSYYVHTIDRSLLERYFLRLKNPKLKDDMETVRRDRKGRIISDNIPKDTASGVTNGSNGSGRNLFAHRSRERFTNASGSRHRRSRSTGAVCGRSLTKHRRIRSRNPRSKRQQLKSKSMKHLQERKTKLERSKRPASSKSVNSRHTSQSAQRGAATLRERLSNLSFTNEPSDMVRSSSFPTFNSLPSSISGHTTPTGSTSVSSATFTNDEYLTSSGTESERFSATLVGDRTVSASATSTPPVAAHEDSQAPNTAQPLRLHLKLSSLRTSNADNKETFPPDGTTIPALDSSVATRRAVRKCRQVSNSQNSAVQNGVNHDRNRHTVLPPNRHQRLAKARIRGAVRQIQSPKRASASRTTQLDLLHRATVEQIRLAPNAPDQVSCNDPAMATFTCHYQPKDLHNLTEVKLDASTTAGDLHLGHSNEPIPLALTQYLELSKRMFMEHFALVRSPAYAAQVRVLLEQEQARHAQLLQSTRSTEQAIGKLHADGTELLRRFTKRLGILITTPSAFFAQARKLIKHHHALEAKIAVFRKQIAELSSANQELVRRHQLEAARLLSSAVQSTTTTACRTINPDVVQSSQLASTANPTNGTSESSILVKTLTDTDPLPSMTKITTYSPSPYSCAQANTLFRPPNRDPLERPPLLHRLDKHISHPQPIPTLPPPLLPMPPPPHSLSVTSSTTSAYSNHHRQPSTAACTSLQDLIVGEFPQPFSAPKPISSGHWISRPAHQLTLPPRKRSWDSGDTHWNHVHKYHRSISPASRNSGLSHLSPPTLSPIEPRPNVGSEDCEQHDAKSNSTNQAYGSNTAVGTPPPLLCSQAAPYRSTSLPDVNQRTPPPISTLPIVVAQALGQ